MGKFKMFGKKRSSSSNSNASSSDTRLSASPSSTSSNGSDPRDPLKGESYFHGMLPRLDCETLLTKDGDFLLRRTEMDGRTVLTLSVRGAADHRVQHFVIQSNENGMHQVAQRPFGSVQDLVDFYQSTRRPITDQPSGPLLLHAIPRQKWQLKHADLERLQCVGRGAFGEVWQARLRMDDDRYLLVAVKCLPLGAVTGKLEREKLMEEARTMRHYRHANVVRLWGVACDEEPFMLVMEWAANGALSDYLVRHHAHLAADVRLRFCIEAAQGLRYLEKKNTIHRDVAARNCLLGQELQVKIADFGLSKGDSFYKETSRVVLPIRWLAPECLGQGVFSLKSDVWAFGVLVCEVFSGGVQPYAGLTTAAVQQKVVREGYRQPVPAGTPDGVREVVMQCWSENPQKRPSFLDLKKRLRREYDTVCKRFNLRNMLAAKISSRNNNN